MRFLSLRLDAMQESAVELRLNYLILTIYSVVVVVSVVPSLNCVVVVVVVTPSLSVADSMDDPTTCLPSSV